TVELAIVGHGDLFEKTAGLVAACKARERISLRGFDEPVPWLAWADCFVLPSTREGLSNALLEAMAAGLPCIANDIIPNREVLHDGVAGRLVPPGDEHALFDAMQEMVSEAEDAARLGCAARERVRATYHIESIAKRYSELYAALAIGTPL